MSDWLTNITKRNELRAVLVLAAVLAIVAVGAKGVGDVQISAEGGSGLVIQAVAFVLATIAEGWGKADYAASFRRWFDGRKFRALMTGVIGALVLALGGAFLPNLNLPPSVYTWLTALIVGYIASVGGVDTIKTITGAP